MYNTYIEEESGRPNTDDEKTRRRLEYVDVIGLETRVLIAIKPLVLEVEPRLASMRASGRGGPRDDEVPVLRAGHNLHARFLRPGLLNSNDGQAKEAHLPGESKIRAMLAKRLDIDGTN